MHVFLLKLKSFRKSLILSSVIVVVGYSALSFKEDYFEISKNLEIFTGLYRDINLYYVDETKPGDLMKKGIDAMLESLDPYTVYIPESRIEDYRMMTTGSYGGIGASIMQIDGKTFVADPYENSPAYKAGIRGGDEILEVDGKKVVDRTTEQITEFLKGQANTEVNITLIPLGSSERSIKKITREVIKIKDVPYFGMLDDKTGYIKLISFTETASSEVKEAFIKLKAQNGMKQLVLDLRGNGGGLLREAVNIVNFFVPKGEVVVDTRGKVKEWDQIHYALNQPLDTEMPLVVLVDGGSASASEIVSGSLQDLDRAVVVGERTYGKGLVQQTRDLFYNSKLKVTVQKYYTPSGRCIQKLDYSHRTNEGMVTEVPDSLLKKFKTKGGRVVMDGRGIDPDVVVEEEELGKIMRPLFEQAVFFKFANKYVLNHPTIPAAKAFHLSDEEYQEFVSFSSTKKLEYKTETELALEQLRKAALKENYFQDAVGEYEAISAKLIPNAKSDLIRFKKQIKLILENEIVARYYFDNGRVEATLADDPCVLQGINTLSKSTYSSILAGRK